MVKSSRAKINFFYSYMRLRPSLPCLTHAPKNAGRPIYNSSLGVCAFSATSQTAGVPTSILYTHFSSSVIFHSSSVSAHANTTKVLLFGPFQQCWPFSYLSATLTPLPSPFPSGGTSSSTVTLSIETKLPIVVRPLFFFDICLVLPSQQSSYVYSPESLVMHWSLRARKTSSTP